MAESSLSLLGGIGGLVRELEPNANLIDVPHRGGLRNNEGEGVRGGHPGGVTDSDRGTGEAPLTSGIPILRSNTSGKGKFAEPAERQ